LENIVLVGADSNSRVEPVSYQFEKPVLESLPDPPCSLLADLRAGRAKVRRVSGDRTPGVLRHGTNPLGDFWLFELMTRLEAPDPDLAGSARHLSRSFSTRLTPPK
jgi:hypothetical protein